MATFAGSDPRLAAEIASLEHRFGKVDVIENETLKVPGSVDTYQLRAQSPNGPYGQPTLSLVSGHYPTAADQVAVTAGVASELNLRLGDIWKVGGASRRVVGIVENPQSLLDEFVLVLPGQVKSANNVTVLFDAPGVAPSSIGEQCASCGPFGGRGSNVSTPASVALSTINPETLSLAVLTIGMLLIALMAIGGFTVLAQRRQRSLGMLASIGATSKNISLVVRANGLVVGVLGAVIGTLLGLVIWLAYRPSLEQSSHHLIGVLALPWVVVAAAIVLAIVATYLAASRPARSITRLSVVAALSGRPAPPKQVHRSALPGIVFLVVAFLLLGYSGGTKAGSGSAGTPELVLGIVALIPAIILLAPFFLVGLGRLARHTPVAVRLALRDLARYRARSASALAAISLGVMIAVIIAIFAQARYADIWDPAGPNLASNEANIETGPPPNPSAQQVKSWAHVAARVGEALGVQQVAALYLVGNLQNSTGSESTNQSLTVATPQLLRVLGIRQSDIAPDADVVTSLPAFAGASGLEFAYCEKAVPIGGPNSGIQAFNCTRNGGLTHPVIQYLAALPTEVHAPDMLLTEHAVHELRISSLVIGAPIGWFAQAAEPFTADQIHNAQVIAATANLSIETRNDEPTSSTLINWATFFGIAIALCILAMSVGLIRSETASDLRTLAATGASSYTRRTLTAATAGALGLAGAVLGTFAGYVGVIGLLRSSSLHGGLSSLANVPVANLLVILLGLPLAAAAVGWLLAGRQPPTLARQPIE
jgi:putative ABC transport system permease protein